MKRTVLFLLVIALAVAFLAGAWNTVAGFGDDVTVTAEHIYGDPTRVAGITTELRSSADNHMLWHVLHTAGDPGTTKTEFEFDQNSVHYFDWEYRHEFNFDISGGFGISTSGGDLAMADDGWGKVFAELAKDVPNGQTLETQILVEDYFDYYPMNYYASINTDSYYLDESHDSLSRDPLSSGSYQQWIRDFKFPVVPGSKGDISLTKTEDGGICQVSVSLYDIGQSGFITTVWDQGMYFAPIHMSYDGEPLHNGEYVMGQGLYHIPFKPDPRVEFHSETTMYAGQFDYDNLELIYPMDPEEMVVSMAPDDSGVLHMITREQDHYRYCALDIDQRKITHEIDLMATDPEETWAYTSFFLDQGLIYLRYRNQAALLDVSREPSLEFIVDVYEELPSTPESVSYQNGTLFTAGFEWFYDDPEHYRRGYYLSAMDEAGFAYYGGYFSNLEDRGHTYSYITMDSITILE